MCGAHTRFATMCLLMVLAPAIAEAQWYRTYEEGRDAYLRGDLTAAEEKLNASVKEAADAGVKPARSVRTYGMRFINFVPDYYLGLVFAQRAERSAGTERLKQLQAADAAFSRVQSAKLLTERDREFSDFRQRAASVQSTLATLTAPAATADVAPPVADQRATAPSSPPAGTRASDSTPLATTEAIAPVPSQTPIVPTNAPAATASAAASPNTTPAPKAPSPGPSQTRIAEPARNAQTQYREPAAPQSQLPTALQQGVRAFFTGDYADAARLLRSVTENADSPPAAHFYLACSYGALAVLREDQDLVAEARAAWGQASRTGTTFAQERRFISPKILQLIADPSSATAR